MKKRFKISVLLLAATIMLTSCMGSFSLTSKMYKFNNSLGNKWLNELVFVACCIVPVYEVTVFVDAIVLNTIEFWTGEKLLASNTIEKQVVKNSEGVNVEITAMENGYNLTDGITSMNLVFDKETQIWSAECNDMSINLVKLIDEDNAQLFLTNGELIDVTLNAEGLDMARMYMNENYAMNN